MKKTYEFRNPIPARGLPAEVVGAAVEAVMRLAGTADNPDGDVTARALVEASRPEDAPLHGLFDWNLEEAALKHNINQARAIIRCYAVVIIKEDRPPLRIDPANVRVVKDNHTAAYVPAQQIVNNREYRRQVIGDSLRQMDGLQRRLASLECMDAGWLDALDALAAARAKIERARPAAEDQPPPAPRRRGQ